MTCSLFTATSYTYSTFACTVESSVINEAALLDWRYFFVNEKDGTGYSTPGLARRALAGCAEYQTIPSSSRQLGSTGWRNQVPTHLSWDPIPREW